MKTGSPGGAWPPLRVETLREPITREDEAEFVKRHQIDRAERLEPKAAITDIVTAPVMRWRLVQWVLGWSRGKRGVWRALLFVPSIVLGILLAGVGLLASFLLVVFTLVFAVVPLFEVVFVHFSGSNWVLGAGWLVGLPVVLAGGFVFFRARGRPVRRQRREVRRGIAFGRLAEANGMRYRPHRSGKKDARAGGRLSAATHQVRRRGSAPFEAGVLGDDFDGALFGDAHARRGYAALRLPTGLPHIVLDARGPNSLLSSSLPGIDAPHASQRLGLEGGFDRYFTLYCPEGYEADALYLFTPDVMERMIDRAARYDVEIIDDWLLLISKKHLGTTNPDDWTEMNEALGVLADRIDRWGRWRDERHFDDERRATGEALPTPRRGAADEGRRLRFGWSAAAVYGGIVILLAFGVAGYAFWEMTRELLADIGAGIAWIGSLF